MPLMTTAAHEEEIAALREENERLRAEKAGLLKALEALLPVAQAFERQASRGAGGRRGGPVFTKARAAIAKAKSSNKHDPDR